MYGSKAVYGIMKSNFLGQNEVITGELAEGATALAQAATASTEATGSGAGQAHPILLYDTGRKYSHKILKI